MWLFRITQTHDGGLKVCAQACARRFGFCYPSSGELWTLKWLEFSTAAMYVLFLSGRVSPHTHQTMQCHIYCV